MIGGRDTARGCRQVVRGAGGGLVDHGAAGRARRASTASAVTDFAAALDARRSAIFHQERLALAAAGTEHQLEAQTRSHDTWAAIAASRIRLEVLLPELAGPAQQAAGAVATPCLFLLMMQPWR
ncbi:hypothetical protein [Streptomyces noursei]|uniref:hypothetical protein n=1 Tax=Streptomyces noursei TaxID=1971 RepID=UPI00069E62FD|nr:hypothetical protein [Streptomyces noursei]